MPVTAAMLGARALRRLNVAAVPADARPVGTEETITVPAIAARALRVVGVNPVVSPAGPLPPMAPSAIPALAVSVLRRLEVIAADETPSAADAATAEARILSVHGALVALGIVSWDVTAIPDGMRDHYVIMAAQLVAPEFGRPSDMALYAAAQEVLRLMALSGASGQAIAEEKVQEVHARLHALGYLEWRATAIPLEVAADYVALTAALLAPLYGKTFDPGEAEGRLRFVALQRRAPALAEAKVMAVHADLDARGIARWTIHDVPDYAEEPYVILAANLLAPEFDKVPDVAGAAWAMRSIFATTSVPTSGQPVVGSYF